MKNNLKYYLFSLILTVNFSTYSQIQIKGVITDSLKKPIPFVNIQLLEKSNQKPVAFTTTDNNGFFLLSVKEKGNYDLKITYIGYQTLRVPLNLSGENSKEYHFVLHEKAEEIKEVLIEGDIPDVIIKKDTILYNVSEYITGTEENLGDLIKKLPGLDIDQNGKIKAKGKQIDKLLIDGEEFFDDQHKLITQNISPEMVKNIELLSNYNAFNAFSNEQTGITALNINLKDKYQNKFTGNISAGYGYENRYTANFNLFGMYKKLKIAFINGANNIGEQSITLEDYLNFQGGIQKYINSDNQIGASVIDEKDIPEFLLSQDNIKKNDSKTSALNMVYKPNDKLKIKLFSILNYSDQEKYEISKQIYFASLANLSSIDTNNIKASFLFNTNVLNAIYKPNDKTILNYTISYSPLSDKENYYIINQTSDTTKTIEQIFDNQSYILGNQLNYIHKFSESVKFNINIYSELYNKNNHLDIYSNGEFLNFTFNSGDYFINQNKKPEGKSLGFYSETKIKLKNKHKIKIFGGAELNTQSYFSELSNDNPDFYNNQFIERRNLYTGIDLSFKIIKLIRLNFGTKFQYLMQTFNDTEESKDPLLFPDAGLTFDFGLNHYLSLSYRYTTEFPDINDYIVSKVIKDFRTVLSNQNIYYNQLIPHNQYQFSYFLFNLENGILLVLNASYSDKTNSIGFNATNYNNLSLLENKITDIDDFGNIFFLFNKDFEKLKFSIQYSTIYSYFNRLNYINDINNKSTTNNIKNAFKFQTNKKDALINYTIGAYYTLNYTSYTNSSFTSELSTFQPYLGFEGNIKQNIKWYLNFDYFYSKTNYSSKDFFDISPKIKYLIHKWTFTVWGSNILNLKNPELIEINNLPDYSQEKVFSLLPGYILFSVKFAF